VLREIAVESTYDLRSLTNTWEGTPESEKVYFSMYLNYYNEEKRRAKTRLVEMTQRYRDFKMALEAMQFNEEAFLQEELSIQAPSEQQESEARARHVARYRLRVAQSRLADLEAGVIQKRKTIKDLFKKRRSQPSSKK
ncbi:hypothetical protein X556_0797, partial [Chlamydia pneumoniae B21]